VKRLLIGPAVVMALALTLFPSTLFAQADPASLVRRYIEAFDRGDLDAAMALLTDDAVMRVEGERRGGHLCDETSCVGKQAIRQEYARRGERHDLTIADLQVAGSTVTVRLEIRSDRIQTSGVGRAVHVWVFRLRGDQIASVEERLDQTDPQTARHRQTRAAGQAAPAAAPAPAQLPRALPRTGQLTFPLITTLLVGLPLLAGGAVLRRLAHRGSG
jgi:ketosteroid isomerase-like protein